MVIVGLSLLGLGFVAISETESAIAKNQQNALQTQAVAEAGAKMIVEWFQDPTWGETYGAMPLNSNVTLTATSIPTAGAIKRMRTVRDPSTLAVTYQGLYKPASTQKLMDKPYRPDQQHRFYGDEDDADITINRTTNAALIDAFNDKLLASDGATATAQDKMAGEVTEIKLFAPPIVGGTLVQGFWSGGNRYGVATIKVTAQEFMRPPAAGAPAPATGVLASHSVRLVVGELPLPIPAGPIQGNANVSFGGNFRVHWGMETSRGDLTPSLNLSSLPWSNAYERPHFEHGYEQGTAIASITITSGGSGYAAAPTVGLTCNAPCVAGGSGFTGTAVLTSGVVTSVTIAAANHGTGYNQQYPPQATFTASPSGNNASGTVNVGAEVWPVAPGSTFDDQDYFHEVLAKDFQDPFYGARAYQDNLLDGATAYNQYPQCFPYQYTADEQSTNQPSYAFQWQDANQYSLKKKVVFPTIVYDYWKRITQSGRGYRGIYYFKYDGPAGGGGGGMFSKFGQGTSQKMSYWANSTVNGANLGAGVFFFDTKNGSNPQLAGADRTQLTDAELWQSVDFNHGMLMAGFVYMNVSSFGTTGQGSDAVTVQANFPGEPYRDVGYPRWNTAITNWDRSCGESTPGANDGQICRVGTGDSNFSCQDLNNNGRCDIVVMQASTWDSHDPNAIGHTSPFTLPQCGSGCSGGRATYIDKVWKSPAEATVDYGAPCTLPAATYDGTNAAPTDCSEPHEPYLNLIFPDQGADNNGSPYKVVVGWEPPGQQTYRPKQVDSQGNVVPCTGPPYDPAKCTSNSYDVDGAVVPLNVILQGILYVEGQWGSEGNAWFFGSVLVQDTINLSAGTADVWFDEKLLKGTWAPPGMPRVIVFSEQTDEQTQ